MKRTALYLLCIFLTLFGSLGSICLSERSGMVVDASDISYMVIGGQAGHIADGD